MRDTAVEMMTCVLPSWCACAIVRAIATQVIQYIAGLISLLDFVLMSLYIWGIPEIRKSVQIIIPILLRCV